jgi:hypothetical protein
MKAEDVIESYVRDVATQLPRAKRGDVAFELRALLHEDLAARAQSAGRAPDRALAMAVLRDFGRPAEAALRYHARPALVEAADMHHFFIWALGGTVVLGLHAALGNEVDMDSVFLQWLGILLLVFALIGWWRRRRPDAFSWKPRRGPDWMPRWESALSLVALVVFPVSMYAAPMAFARLLLPDTVSVAGMALAPEFAGSALRLLTQCLLVALALQYVISLLLGAMPRWLRLADVALDLSIGLLLIAHASPAQRVFASDQANGTAAPLFLAVGGMMLLFGLYYAYREWARIRPAPARAT